MDLDSVLGAHRIGYVVSYVTLCQRVHAEEPLLAELRRIQCRAPARYLGCDHVWSLLRHKYVHAAIGLGRVTGIYQLAVGIFTNRQRSLQRGSRRFERSAAPIGPCRH